MFAYEIRLDWQAFYEFDTFMTIRLSLDPYFHQSETETRWILFNKFPDATTSLLLNDFSEPTSNTRESVLPNQMTKYDRGA